MGKLRHIAIAVPNTDEAATFYEQAFGLKRVRQSVSAILMSDGVISIVNDLHARNSWRLPV